MDAHKPHNWDNDEDDYWEWHFQQDYIPPEVEESAESPDTQDTVEEPPSLPLVDVQEALAELQTVYELGRNENLSGFLGDVTYLRNARGEYAVRAPCPPFLQFEEMTPQAKALWIAVSGCADGDQYTCAPNVVGPILQSFYRIVLGYDGRHPAADLSDAIKHGLVKQLGIGDHLLTHPYIFEDESEQRGDMMKFSSDP
jgi:hypothetical protein